MKKKVIGRIKKAETLDIVLKVDEYGGLPGLTIREFLMTPRYTGFTKSGVRISGKDFKFFKKLINSIDEKTFDVEPEKKNVKKKKTKKKVKKK